MSEWAGRRVQRLTLLTLETYGTVCHLCGLPGATTADHVIPRVHGGADSLDNLRPAHLGCNSSRGSMTLEEWFASRAIAFDGRSFFKPAGGVAPRLASSIFPDPPHKNGPRHATGPARFAPIAPAFWPANPSRSEPIGAAHV